jgi:hypothetical protein
MVCSYDVGLRVAFVYELEERQPPAFLMTNQDPYHGGSASFVLDIDGDARPEWITKDRSN